MRRTVILIAILPVTLALSLGGCATSKPPKLAVCDGKPKHRRDANPYGSVLPGAPAVPTSAKSQSADPPPPPPAKTSAAVMHSYYASC